MAEAYADAAAPLAAVWQARFNSALAWAISAPVGKDRPASVSLKA
jgi:hypothetical protein